MPPPVFSCVVCGSQVSKRNSYAVKDGRACRAHEEAQSAKKERDQKSLEERLAAAKRFEKKREPGFSSFRAMDFKLRCMCCERQGRYSNQIASDYLIASIFVEQKYGSWNPFGGEDLARIREFYPKFRQEVALFAFPCDENHPVYKVVPGRHKNLIEIAKFVVVCYECSERHNFKHKEPDLDEVMKFSGIFEAFIKPGLQEVAREVLTTKHQQN